MTELKLTLRQRQLIHYLQHASGYVTGNELAKVLHTSSRTVRTDVSELNSLLKKDQIQILSKHHHGYRLHAEDPESLKDLTRSAESYLSRTERLRHLVLRLSLSDIPLDLDELSDEMYISKATLENDLKSLRKEFLLRYPFIRMARNKNRISFENDERKKRAMLCQLYADSWDYISYGNAFYQYEYLDEDTVRLCTRKLHQYMVQYKIRLEDTNVVHLNLQLAIALRRMSDGHVLTARREKTYLSESVKNAVTALLDDLEETCDCTFPEAEREDIREMVSSGVLPDMDLIRAKGAGNCFSASLIAFADSFLDFLKGNYGLDFKKDEDFYLTLLIYFRYLTLPVHYLNEPGIGKEILLKKYAIELELAFSVEPFALSYYGNYLDFQELLYLGFLFSGALVRIPFPKIRTVILSQHNEPAAWNLRMQIEDHFLQFLDITALSPFYGRNPETLQNTDLVIQTVQADLPEIIASKKLLISPWFDGNDYSAIESRIRHIRFRGLYGHDYPPVVQMMENAEWLENQESDSFFDLLLLMGTKLVHDGYADEEYLRDLLRRNSVLSFAVQPSFILAHSAVPAQRTHILVAILKHRIRVNAMKIRTVILFCMKKEDPGLAFKLYNDLYDRIPDPEAAQDLKTKEEWMAYLRT